MHLIFLLFFALLPGWSFGQGQNFSSDYKGEREPPFEKIYVQPWQIVTMPDGIYFCDEEGNRLKVDRLSADVDGMYVIRITHQCPCCGRCFEGKYLDEEYGCPLFQRKVSSRLWID